MHADNPSAEVFLKEGSLNAGPDDSAFLQSLRWSLNTPRGAYPPALAEIYREHKLPLTKIRRLHLMVVDLDRSRSVSTRVYQDFKKCQIPADLAGCLNTLPVPISRRDCPFRVRFVFAYSVDNSDRPSYLLWPHRGAGGQFSLVDPWSGKYFDLAAASFIAPIGLEHFFDAFALNQKRLLRVDAAAALHPPLDDVSDTLVVKQARADMFDLTPVWAPVEPPTKRAKTAEVRLSSTGDVSMTPRNEENAQGIVLTRRIVIALALTLTLAAKMTLRMFLIWTSSKKRTLTSVLSPLGWTHVHWSGIAQVIQMRRSLVLTCLEGWRHYTP